MWYLVVIIAYYLVVMAAIGSGYQLWKRDKAGFKELEPLLSKDREAELADIDLRIAPIIPWVCLALVLAPFLFFVFWVKTYLWLEGSLSFALSIWTLLIWGGYFFYARKCRKDRKKWLEEHKMEPAEEESFVSIDVDEDAQQN